MLEELDSQRNFLLIHMDDLEPISYGDDCERAVLNYLILRHNSMSLGASQRDINYYVEFDALHVVSKLVKERKILRIEHSVLGIIYAYNVASNPQKG